MATLLEYGVSAETRLWAGEASERSGLKTRVGEIDRRKKTSGEADQKKLRRCDELRGENLVMAEAVAASE